MLERCCEAPARLLKSLINDMFYLCLIIGSYSINWNRLHVCLSFSLTKFSRRYVGENEISSGCICINYGFDFTPSDGFSTISFQFCFFQKKPKPCKKHPLDLAVRFPISQVRINGNEILYHLLAMPLRCIRCCRLPYKKSGKMS